MRLRERGVREQRLRVAFRHQSTLGEEGGAVAEGERQLQSWSYTSVTVPMTGWSPSCYSSSTRACRMISRMASERLL